MFVRPNELDLTIVFLSSQISRYTWPQLYDDEGGWSEVAKDLDGTFP